MDRNGKRTNTVGKVVARQKNAEMVLHVTGKKNICS
jgi:hypothetical protein